MYGYRTENFGIINQRWATHIYHNAGLKRGLVLASDPFPSACWNVATSRNFLDVEAALFPLSLLFSPRKGKAVHDPQ